MSWIISRLFVVNLSVYLSMFKNMAAAVFAAMGSIVPSEYPLNYTPPPTYPLQSMRRGAPDFGSPPATQPSGGYFPHDLDDIYESQGDHQYFTHTGAIGQQRSCERPTALSIFHRVSAAATSLDDYSVGGSRQSMNSTDSGSLPVPGGGGGAFVRHRFDNSSFAKSLSVDEQDPAQNHSPHKDGHKQHKQHNHHHHHHSIQEIFKHLGKKMHVWPRKHHDAQSVCTSPQNDPQENFRTRSKSLDVNTLSRRNRILDDCGATYKIYDRIVKEGKRTQNQNQNQTQTKTQKPGTCCLTIYVFTFHFPYFSNYVNDLF